MVPAARAAAGAGLGLDAVRGSRRPTPFLHRHVPELRLPAGKSKNELVAAQYKVGRRRMTDAGAHFFIDTVCRERPDLAGCRS